MPGHIKLANIVYVLNALPRSAAWIQWNSSGKKRPFPDKTHMQTTFTRIN